MRRILLSFLVLALTATVQPAEGLLPLYTGRASTPRPPTGTGIEVVTGTGAWCPFKNIARCANPWAVLDVRGVGVRQSDMPVGSDGYPSQAFTSANHFAGTVVNADISGHYASGDYVLLFEGSGTVSVGGDATPASSSSGRFTFTVPSTSDNGIMLVINSTTSSDRVRNIRVGIAVDEAAITDSTSTIPANVFNTDWLALAAEFDVLYLPHWQREWRNTYDTSTPPDWADRPILSTAFTQATAAGVSHDAAFILAQGARANLWISVPWNATHAYVQGLAQQYAASPAYVGNSSRKLYVTDSTHVLYIEDVSNRVARHKMIASAFSAAFAQRFASQVELVLDCQDLSICGRYFAFLNPLETTYDASFRSSIKAVATDAKAMSGNARWSPISPNPYYYKLRPYVSDIRRVAQEELWAREPELFEFIAFTATLDLPTYGYAAGVLLQVPGFNNRFRIPGTELAAIEQQLEDNFFAYEKSNPAALGDLTAEWAERWYRNGGSVFVIGKLVSRGVECKDADTRLEGMNRLQCGYYGLTRDLSDAAAAARLTGLRRWRAADNAYLDALFVNEGPAARQTCSPGCVWGDCIEGECECYSGYTGSDCNTFDATKLANRCSPDDYAMNIGGWPDWTGAWPWTDMSMYSRQWVHQPVVQPSTARFGWIWSYSDAHNASKLELREDGFPTRLVPNEAVSTFQRRDTYQYDHGVYHLFYDGDGVITVGMDTHIDRRVRPGHYILEVKPVKQLNNGLFYKIERTNPDDPVRNVRIVHASMLHRFQSQPFHPLFTRSLQEYRHIRFMGAMLGIEANFTNATAELTWDMRARTFHYSQATNGIAIEYVVRLCNTIHARPWINIPFHANDGYVRETARYIRDHLNPALFPVTVEYSNEVWAAHHNIGFYAQDRAIAAGIADGSDVVRARSCWVQRRSREIWAIFQQENVTVHRVLGGQYVQTRVLREALECEPNAASEVDTLVIAPYLGTSLNGPTALLQVDDVFNAVAGALNDTANYVAQHKALADEFGLQLGSYEAGPAFFGGAEVSDPDVEARGMAVHRSPRMKELVQRYMAALRDAGSTAVNAYFTGPADRWSTYGAFGIREYQNQDPATSYKVQGLEAYAIDHATCDRASMVSQQVLLPTGCPNDCTNRGFCMRDGTCQCYWGFNGTDCSNSFTLPDADHCNSYTCADKGGACAPVGRDGVFVQLLCQGCDAGWGGWACHVPVCTVRNNCSFNGVCAGPQQCRCYRGHSGDSCEHDCGCNGHGECTFSGTCRCDEGYTLKDGQCVPACACDRCLAPDVCACEDECVYGHCWAGLCRCWDGFSGATCTDRDPSFRADNFASPMGINVAGISDWASTTEFVNYMWRSRDWFMRQANELQPTTRWTVPDQVHLTEEGYPAFLPIDRVASTFAMRDTRATIPGGRYHVYYDGEGLIEFGMDAQAVESDEAKGYVQVDYTPTTVRDNGFFITIRRTNPSNPIRNIRILPPTQPHPAYFSSMPFTDSFLEDLRPFRALRFYNWQRLENSYSNGSAYHVRTWAGRKRLYAASMATGYGVNEDLMIHLCNVLGAEPWFTIPHDADDDYVDKMARLIRRRLRPDVMVHIEHSNEVWNYAFESHKYAVFHGRRLYGSALAVDEAAMRYHGARSQQIWTSFRNVFGSVQQDRLKFHLGTWVISPRHTRLAGLHITIRPVTVAVTHYFCGEETFGGSAAAQILSVAQLAQGCAESVGFEAGYFSAQIAAASELGFETELSAYESGPSLVQYSAMMGGYPRPGVSDLYASMHRHTSMRATVAAHFDSAKTHGLTMPMYFTTAAKYTIYGSWGIKETTAQACADSAKCQGAADWIAANYNDTARLPRWGMVDYGVNNVVSVTFDRVPTKAELDYTARNLEVRLSLPVFAISAVVEDVSTTDTSRRQAGGNVLFIVAEILSGAEAQSAANQLSAAITSTSAGDLGLGGFSLTNVVVVVASDPIFPKDELPPSMTNPPPVGGYPPPPPAFNADGPTTPPPTGTSGGGNTPPPPPSGPLDSPDDGAPGTGDYFRSSASGVIPAGIVSLVALVLPFTV
jgi:hypothetical protein